MDIVGRRAQSVVVQSSSETNASQSAASATPPAVVQVQVQVQVQGDIAGRAFVGGSIFAMPSIGDPSRIQTMIFTDRRKSQEVCRQVSGQASDEYYDHITLWNANAVGSYQLVGGPEAKNTAHVQSYQSEGTEQSVGFARVLVCLRIVD